MRIDEIVVGDTVVLNSGGPIMTISSFIDDDTEDIFVECKWMAQGAVQSSVFYPEMLYKVNRQGVEV